MGCDAPDPASARYIRRRAPIAQLAEAADLKSVQCRFESDWGHEITGPECAGQRDFYAVSAAIVAALGYILATFWPEFRHVARHRVQIGVEQIGIDVQRHRGAGVAQHALDDLRVGAGVDRQ